MRPDLNLKSRGVSQHVSRSASCSGTRDTGEEVGTIDGVVA